MKDEPQCYQIRTKLMQKNILLPRRSFLHLKHSMSRPRALHSTAIKNEASQTFPYFLIKQGP